MMRRSKQCFLISFVFMTIYLYFTLFYVTDQSREKKNTANGADLRSIGSTTANARIALSLVVCETRYNESLSVIKSALLFSKSLLHFIIFTDNNLKIKFYNTLSNWKILTKNKLEFELHDISFPEAYKEEWLNLFKKCAAQRLFLPVIQPEMFLAMIQENPFCRSKIISSFPVEELIPHIDSVIYVDTDTLFLGPVEDLWYYFSEFNSSHISAATIEDDNPNVSWYPRFARHPFYGKYGLNSGVMLLNLTRMRTFGWEQYLTPIMLKWKQDIPWGDQDIINIIFHYNSVAVLELPCYYNYRPDQCMYGNSCKAASDHGVLVLHGNRQVFHNEHLPAFRAVYRAVDEYGIGQELTDSLIINMKKYLSELPISNCVYLRDLFLKIPTQLLNGTYNYKLSRKLNNYTNKYSKVKQKL